MARGNRANREVRVGRRELRREKREGREFNQKFDGVRQASVVKVVPKNEAQALFLSQLDSEEIVVGMGCAGTGKTFMAATHAANQYLRNPNTKIYISRPYVPMGKSAGLLPGTFEEKMAPFLAPITSVLKAQLGTKYEADFGKNISIQLLEAIRGLDLQDAILIVDEAQNLNIDEVKSIVTRLGENSQIILIGDGAQSDLREEDSGLPWLVDLVDRHGIDGVAFTEFYSSDIVRHGIVRRFVEIFEMEGKRGRT